MNNKRRILLIALSSWGVVGLRARSKNPLTAGLGLMKTSASVAKSAARASYPIARLSLRWLRRGAWRAARFFLWPKK